MQRLTSLSLLALVALALGACGSSGEKKTTSSAASAPATTSARATTSTPTTTTRPATSGGGLSKARLTAAATPVCRAAIVAVGRIPSPTNIRDPAQASAYFDKVDQVARAELKGLTALEPNAAAKPAWDRFIVLETSATSLLHTIRRKADRNDATGLADLKTLATLTPRVDAAGRVAGAGACAG